jgi:hypothetical protein
MVTPLSDFSGTAADCPIGADPRRGPRLPWRDQSRFDLRLCTGAHPALAARHVGLGSNDLSERSLGRIRARHEPDPQTVDADIGIGNQVSGKDDCSD